MPFGLLAIVLVMAPSACSSHGEQSATAVVQTRSGTMRTDLESRSQDIHWPAGFKPKTADLFAHNELRIHGTCEKVWVHLVDAGNWPQWYPNSKDVRVNGGGKLSQGGVFHWTTFGVEVESKVHKFEPHRLLSWYGAEPGTAPAFYHVWHLTPVGSDCHVVTEEVGKGAAAAGLRASDEGLMHRGHDLWLAALKWVSEGR